ncbi:hypothetical protein DFQ27_004469 [Actinomortierella ambigua]|uniref:Uncharacterized protein n=1 Tax=Actinomortierella ambigua TaxID=1343610 RepID=A0A9P6UCG3_9FUNG|nr:hypothetical protein DFQ27_004469 [Actinomortierella ambigua]
MRVAFSVFSVAFLAASVVAVNTCDDRLPGLCIPTSQCTSGGGTYRSGLCPKDPANVKCCTYGTCTWNDNGSWAPGGCMPTANCRQYDGVPIPGRCPGPADIQCCPM